jgi:hypothetical protein
MKDPQCTDTVMLIRPVHFGFNPETATNNVFQSSETNLTPDEIRDRACDEVEGLKRILESAGVDVLVIDDTDKPIKPDAVFPNNWISTHSNGAIITYPMQAKARRKERREDIIELLMKKYAFDRRYSLEQYEARDLFLEGTGSMVLDRTNKVVYACISQRTDPTILDKFCALTGYQRIVFGAKDERGKAIYHTNVMMCLGENFAVVCTDSIDNADEASLVSRSIEVSRRELIEISHRQMRSFTGNMLQLVNKDGQRLIVMSQQAYDALNMEQKHILATHGEIIYTSLETIEHFGGGSARCMIAEIFRPFPGASF